MATLPAARKKSDERRYPVKSSYKDWLAGCARNKRSYEGLLLRLERRYGVGANSSELGGGDGKSRGRRKNSDDSVSTFIGRQRSKEMTRSSLLMPAERIKMPKRGAELG